MDYLQFEKDEAIERIHEMHSETLQILTGDATLAERDTWAIKELAANNHLAGILNAADENMLATEAAEIGLTVDQLSNTVIKKSSAFKYLVGKAAGLRSKSIAAITACATVEEVAIEIDNIETQSDAEIAAFKAATGM